MAQIITQNAGGGGGGGATYTAGDGIDISAQNEISVDADIISGAEAGATALQPGDNISDLENDAGFIDSSALSGYQTTANMVTSLSGADNDHYPTALAVANAISSSGGGDVMGPSSSTDGDIVLFDGTTGKAIKDSSKKLSDYQEKLTAQTAYTSKGTASKVPQITTNALGQVTGVTEIDITYPSQVDNTAYASSWDGVTTTAPSKNAVYDKLESMSSTISGKVDNTAFGSSWDGVTSVAPSKNAVYDKISDIDGLIPSAATSSNKLADKNYVDDSINSVTAYYITKNAQGDQWATRAELFAATTFYSGGVVRVPTKNDYTIVLADENHDNATTRYIYNSGWEYQYTVNETALTQAQLDALNSGITSAKVTTYDGYATGKQNTLATQTAYTSKGTSTKVATITTNTLGQVTAISETSISFPVTSVNGSTGEVTGLQTTANLKTDLTDNSDSYYPSQKAVKTAVDGINQVPTTGNTGDVLTKTAIGYEFAAPAAAGITNETTGTTTTVTKIRAGTEAEYALITPNATTIYYVF